EDCATLPGALLIGVHAGGGEDALDLHALPLAATSRPCACAGRLCHCWPPWPLFRVVSLAPTDDSGVGRASNSCTHSRPLRQVTPGRRDLFLVLWLHARREAG